MAEPCARHPAGTLACRAKSLKSAFANQNRLRVVQHAVQQCAWGSQNEYGAQGHLLALRARQPLKMNSTPTTYLGNIPS